jgi:hypothetical protein
MIFSTTRGGAASAATCLFATALTACAAPDQFAAQASPSLRVVVKLVRSSGDAEAIAAEATRVAGVPVRHVAATSLAWHALGLECASVARCDAALARLRAADTIYQAVEIDGRKSRSAS